jgi:signal transduction histidine kinase
VSRRIFAAIMGVAVLAVVVFGVPLAVAIEQAYRGQAVSRLVTEATRAGAAVPVDFATGSDPAELVAPPDGSTLTLYDAAGSRRAGSGPAHPDKIARRALAGDVANGVTSDAIVVAVPLTSNEQVYGTVRASLPQDAVETPVHALWTAMGLLGLATVALAAVVGRWLAGRLVRPVASLAGAAARLGDGDFSVRAGRSGVHELDAAARSIESTAERLGQALARERAFSSHASHQLRTPLTALRIGLEAAQLAPDADLERAISEALDQVDRLGATIEDLLLLARDRPTPRDPLPVETMLDEIEHAWRGRLAADSRPFRVRAEPDLPDVRAAAPAVRQVLNVLLDNALRHGRGAVDVRARPAASGIAIEVTDEGPGIDGDPETVFRRQDREGAGGGIGLALARSLAEVEGGRLLLRSPGPNPTFSLVLPGASDRSPAKRVR